MRLAQPSSVAAALALVAPAETAFRSRWRMSTLEKSNKDLHDAVVEQMQLHDAALIAGSDDEVRIQSEAMVRGWRAACSALEAPLQPDDAYFEGHFEGWDMTTGLRVVIGQHKASLARVQAKDGRRVIFMTPDEVATLVAGHNLIAETKVAFPDAEVIGPACGPTGGADQ